MQSPSNSTGYVFLLLAQVILGFGLGIFGGKLSDIINISPKLVLVGSIILITLSWTVAFSLTPNNNSAPNTQIHNSLYVPSRVITMFPAAIILGLLSGFFSVSLMPIPNTKFNFRLFTSHDYEILTYLSFIFSMFVLIQLKRDHLLILTYAIGFAAGVSSSVLLLRPEENDVLVTILVKVSTMSITALLLNSTLSRSLLDTLTRSRS